MPCASILSSSSSDPAAAPGGGAGGCSGTAASDGDMDRQLECAWIGPRGRSRRLAADLGPALVDGLAVPGRGAQQIRRARGDAPATPPQPT